MPCVIDRDHVLYVYRMPPCIRLLPNRPQECEKVEPFPEYEALAVLRQ